MSERKNSQSQHGSENFKSEQFKGRANKRRTEITAKNFDDEPEFVKRKSIYLKRNTLKVTGKQHQNVGTNKDDSIKKLLG